MLEPVLPDPIHVTLSQFLLCQTQIHRPFVLIFASNLHRSRGFFVFPWYFAHSR